MKHTHLLTAFCLALFILAPAGVRGEDSVPDLIKQGDVFDLKFKPKEALSFYLPAEKLDPKNVALILCIARQYRHLMADETDTEEKLKLGLLGKSYARRAVALAPKDAEAHLSVAISYAKMIPLLDSKAQMEASKEVKASVDKSISLDCHKDLAWHILGCWNQRMADIGMVKRALARVFYGKLPDATNEDAVKCFQEAIKLNPSRPLNYIELGRTYAQMGQAAEARQYIKKGLALPDIGKDDPEGKRRGRETLSSL